MVLLHRRKRVIKLSGLRKIILLLQFGSYKMPLHKSTFTACHKRIRRPILLMIDRYFTESGPIAGAENPSKYWHVPVASCHLITLHLPIDWKGKKPLSPLAPYSFQDFGSSQSANWNQRILPFIPNLRIIQWIIRKSAFIFRIHQLHIKAIFNWLSLCYRII